MKRPPPIRYYFSDKKRLILIITSSLLISSFSLLLLFSLTLTRQPQPDPNPTPHSLPSSLKLPRFAYLIAGTRGDGPRLKRLLQAVYHPRNYYLLHLDLEASDSERLELAKYVKSDAILMRNVMVVGKANLITYKGPTMIACTLHAVAILLKLAKNWDWFINLSASDYPLMPQDG